jgi:hypothetical protein
MLAFLIKYKTLFFYSAIALLIIALNFSSQLKENKINELEKNLTDKNIIIDNYKLELEKQTLLLEEEKANVKIVRKVQKEVSKEKVELNKNLKKLESKFNNHDTEKLIYKKPELIEKIINDASKKKTDCFNSNFTDC